MVDFERVKQSVVYSSISLYFTTRTCCDLIFSDVLYNLLIAIGGKVSLHFAIHIIGTLTSGLPVPVR